MTPRSRKVAVFVGTAALAAGAGIGVALLRQLERRH